MIFVTQAATAGATTKAGQTNVKMVILNPGTAATALTLKDATGGAVMLTLVGAANGSSVPVPLPDGLSFGSEVFTILTGAGATVWIGY